MAKGGRRSTTWNPAWKSGKTTVIRVPEVLAPELLRVAHVLDEGGILPVTKHRDSQVTDDRETDTKALKDAAGTFLMTVPPRERKEAKRWIDRFMKSIEKR